MTKHTPQIISRNATCKRCGSKTVTWQKSEAGKWFLTEVFNYPRLRDDAMDEMTMYVDFHSTYCGKPAVHQAKQDEIIAEHVARKIKLAQESDDREALRIIVEADKLAAFLRATPDERAEITGKLERTIKREQEGLTMDYMSEYNKSLIIIEECRAELNMYADFMEDVDDD